MSHYPLRIIGSIQYSEFLLAVRQGWTHKKFKKFLYKTKAESEKKININPVLDKIQEYRKMVTIYKQNAS